MALQSRCPHCRKTLKLKSKSAFGKQVPCPKCGERFTVKPFKAPAPEPEDEWEDDGYEEAGYEDDYGDDYGDGYEDDYGAPAPKRSSRSKSGSKKKKKKKRGSGTPAWMVGLGIGGGVVAALGLLVGLVMFLMGGGGGGVSNVINLAWLPADADIFVQVKPKEMWNAPILAPLRNSELMKLAMQNATQQGLPVESSDIDSITLAVVGAGDMYEQRQNLFGGAMGQPQMVEAADPKMVGVMRLSKQLTEDDFSNLPAAEKRDHNGSELWVSQQGGKEVAFHLVDATTVLFGEPEQVTSAIDRGPTEERVERIDFINPDHQFVFAFAPQEIRPSRDQSLGDSSGEALANSLNESARGFSLGLSLTSDVELEARVVCNAADDATKIQRDVESAVKEALAKLEEMGSASSPMPFMDFSAFINVGRESVESFKVSRSGDQVTVAGRIPGSISDAIQELTSNPMIAAMIEGAIKQAGSGATGMTPGSAEFPGAPGSGGTGSADTYSPDALAGENSTPPSFNTSPDAAEQANIDAVNQEKVDTTETLDGIRDKVKDTTGTILTFPGGGQRKLPTGTAGSGGVK